MRQSYHSSGLSHNSDGPLLNWDGPVSASRGVQITRPAIPGDLAHRDLAHRGGSGGGIIALDTNPANPFSDNSAVYRPSGPLGLAYAYSSREPSIRTPVPRKHVSLTPSDPSIYPPSIDAEEMDKFNSPTDRYSAISEEGNLNYQPMTPTSLSTKIPQPPLISAPLPPTSPPLPAKSPLRAALSQRTLINVSETCFFDIPERFIYKLTGFRFVARMINRLCVSILAE